MVLILVHPKNEKSKGDRQVMSVFREILFLRSDIILRYSIEQIEQVSWWTWWKTYPPCAHPPRNGSDAKMQNCNFVSSLNWAEMMIVIEVALDVQSPNQRWELKLGRVNIQSDLANIIITVAFYHSAKFRIYFRFNSKVLTYLPTSQLWSQESLLVHISQNYGFKTQQHSLPSPSRKFP